MRCREWVALPISLEGSESSDLKAAIKNRPNCPKCGEMTSCSKENVCVLDANGNFVSIDL